MNPTQEQLDIVNLAKTSQENILISALAGAAKTSTLVLIAQALTSTPILSIAFNKKIAEEMSTRLPSHVTCKTLNSLGHSIWSAQTPTRLTLDVKKNYSIIEGLANNLTKAEKKLFPFAQALHAMSWAKRHGYLPEGRFPDKKGLVSQADFIEEAFDEDPDSLTLQLVETALTQSVADAYKGRIDFDDQLLMPVIFGGQFPRFPLVLIDEAQDLSLLNHAFVERLVTKRLIAVGDRHQSIYAFRGAMTSSMDQLKAKFQMKEMPLTVSFRCPRAVVDWANQWVPAMRAGPQAQEGLIQFFSEGWSAEDIPPDAAIICRNNAPLLSLAFRLLRSGRPCQVIGKDIGSQVVKALEGLGPETLTQPAIYKAIAKWEAQKESKSKRKAASFSDRADCMRVFADLSDDLGGAIRYARHLFSQEGPLQLMTGHKAKGLEFSTVVHLDSWRIPSFYAEGEEELQQEENINYVITTRTKDRLIFADLEKMEYE